MFERYTPISVIQTGLFFLPVHRYLISFATVK